jgi:hypothetical protein
MNCNKEETNSSNARKKVIAMSKEKKGFGWRETTHMGLEDVATNRRERVMARGREKYSAKGKER